MSKKVYGPFHTLEQVAEYLGVSLRQVQRMCQAGTLRATTIPGGSRGRRIPQSEIDRYETDLAKLMGV